MFDWIPISSYTAIYYNIMMILMLITLFRAYQFEFFDETTITFSKGIGFFLVFYIIFYLGTRPISYVFGDMGTYGKYYNRYAAGETFVVKKDYLFNYFMISNFLKHLVSLSTA